MRGLLDAKLTELGLYTKELCPEGAVEMSTVRYEDEDGHVTLVAPAICSEADEDRIELALAARAGEVFEGSLRRPDSSSSAALLTAPRAECARTAC